MDLPYRIKPGWILQERCGNLLQILWEFHGGRRVLWVRFHRWSWRYWQPKSLRPSEVNRSHRALFDATNTISTSHYVLERWLQWSDAGTLRGLLRWLGVAVNGLWVPARPLGHRFYSSSDGNRGHTLQRFGSDRRWVIGGLGSSWCLIMRDSVHFIGWFHKRKHRWWLIKIWNGSFLGSMCRLSKNWSTNLKKNKIT